VPVEVTVADSAAGILKFTLMFVPFTGTLMEKGGFVAGNCALISLARSAATAAAVPSRGFPVLSTPFP
jgi:hypothetical protein